MKSYIKLLGVFCVLTVLFSSCEEADPFVVPHDMTDEAEFDGDLWWTKTSDIKDLKGIIISGDWTTPGNWNFQFVDEWVWGPDAKSEFSNNRPKRYGIHPVKQYTVAVWDHEDGTFTTTVEFKYMFLSGIWYFEGDCLVLRDSNNEVYKKIELEYGMPVKKGDYIPL